MTLGESLSCRAPNGFNTIRLLAAIMVIVSHAFPIVTGSNASEPLNVVTHGQATFGALAVGIFFVISGLLISQSLDNSSSLLSFVRKRALRIMPALIVACLVCILLVGPLATDLPLPAYYARSWAFMRNAVFIPTDYSLPGVFSSNPTVTANGSLWSLKFEVAAYAATVVLLFRGRLLLATWMLSFLLAPFVHRGGALFYVGQMAELFRYFGSGMMLYRYRDKVALRADWAVAALTCVVVYAFTPLFTVIASTLGAYGLVSFAYLCPAWFRSLTNRGDISYGTYLYAFPIQQLMLPLSGGQELRNIALSLPATILIATLSWIVVERPALELKRRSRPALSS